MQISLLPFSDTRRPRNKTSNIVLLTDVSLKWQWSHISSVTGNCDFIQNTAVQNGVICLLCSSLVHVVFVPSLHGDRNTSVILLNKGLIVVWIEVFWPLLLMLPFHQFSKAGNLIIVHYPKLLSPMVTGMINGETMHNKHRQIFIIQNNMTLYTFCTHYRNYQ